MIVKQMNPERIGGYEIQSELGRGAMGVVYRAHDKGIDRPVAIKVIRIDPGTTAQEGANLRQRLIREASTAGKISHPGIVTVHQLGEDGDNVFIVMEFVEGQSLEKLLASNAGKDPSWGLDILAQIGVALDYAHKSNVVHRDIKPANILIRDDGRVKIADFGIAKITASSSTMTSTGVMLGSPAYMSPEQVQAAQIDGRSDQFALATIAFLMLAGRMPFKGSTVHTLMYQIVTADPFEPLPGDNPVSPAVRAVLTRALSKQPFDRYPDCTSFIHELTDAFHGVATPAPAQRSGAMPPVTPSTSAPPPVYTPPSAYAAPPVSEPQQAYASYEPVSTPAPVQKKTNVVFPIVAGVLFLALIAAGGYYWYSRTCCAPPAPGPEVSNTTPTNPTAPNNPTKPTTAPAGGTPLLVAIGSGKVDEAKSLISKGANVNEAGPDGTTPLMAAAEGTANLPDNGPMVDALLAAGAQVEAADSLGRTALYRAAGEGRTAAMSLLLDHQANVNSRAGNQATPLIEAVSHGRLEAAQLLVDRRADVNLTDSSINTPLMIAAETSPQIHNPGDFVRLLLKHGAKRGLKDSRGKIAFQKAVDSKNAEAIALLR